MDRGRSLGRKRSLHERHPCAPITAPCLTKPGMVKFMFAHTLQVGQSWYYVRFDGGTQIEAAERKGLRMKTGVECEFFLLTSGVETEIADSKDVANKPCYDQVW
jgi:hypothetical protein